MKKIFKKNQIMITAVAIMIAIAGYLNFAGDKIGDEHLLSMDGDVSETSDGVYAVNVTDTDEEANQFADVTDDIYSMDEDTPAVADNYLDENMSVISNEVADASSDSSVETINDGENNMEDIPGDAIFTNGTSISNLASAKLMKEQSRAKNKETLLEIINNDNVTEESKQGAINSMIALTSQAEMESAAEVLLEAKGFANVVVSLNEEKNTADVIVAADSLTDAQTAQIMDIVTRKTEVSPEHIIITMTNAE